MDASTGSPASRKLTKLTPLTTRPSLTSRQGMTRILNMPGRRRRTDELQCLRRIEPAIIERAANDGAFKYLRTRRQQRAHVVDRGKPTRGDDRNRELIGECDRSFEVEALEHPIARYVRIDDGGDTGIFETLGDIERGKLRRLRPAFNRDLAVARIESDGDATRMAPRGFLHQRRVAHGGRTDDDARDALAEPRLDRGAVADAAAKLHRDFHRTEDVLDRRS